MTSINERWVAVLSLDDLAHHAIMCMSVEGVALLLVRDGERVFACERACPHEQADLRLGRVTDGQLFCPRHLASFDLRDGHISQGWSSRSLRRYPVRIEDGRIWIDAEAVKSAAT